MGLDWLRRPILLVFLIIFMHQSMPVFSISDSEALIKLKNSFTNATALSSWVDGSDPCKKGDVKWSGILCNKGRVSGIRLENMDLSGKIDIDALVEISGLRSVSFARNSFSGSIPELNRLGYLKNIFLSANQFSGEIPSEFFLKMASLKKVWLSNNKFSGNIPPSLMHISNLLELRLENNGFSGVIPSISQSKLAIFNVSNNKLSGQIPDGLEKFNASSFLGNPELCGKQFGRVCNGKPASLPTASSGNNSSGPNKESSGNISSEPNNVTTNDKATSTTDTTRAGIITLAAMLLSVVAVLLFKLRRKKDEIVAGGNAGRPVELKVTVPDKSKELKATKKAGSSRKGSNPNKGDAAAKELVMVNDEKGVFGLQDLMKAAAEVLGNGGLGLSYKASMAGGGTVVVKRMRDLNALGKDEFDAEIRKLGRLRHPNILPPLAYLYRKEEKLLIHGFIPKGSLLYLLHGDKGRLHAELDWPTRLKIVVGIARGLGYLHNELASCQLPHGNLKSSNIFLSQDNEPKISEFGFHQLINHSVEKKGLLAYKAPEVAQLGVSRKCDVYCLGLIILEILTGKFPSQYLNSDEVEIDLVESIETSIPRGKESELLDPYITSSTKSLGEMIELLHIGARCVRRNPDERLNLEEAVQRIEEIILRNCDSRMNFLPSLRDGFADA